MQKIPNSNRLVPYNYGHRFKDGSLRTDIPTQTLHNYFNVNYSIVSQVNPHIHIFFYANQGSPGRPVTHRYGKGWYVIEIYIYILASNYYIFAWLIYSIIYLSHLFIIILKKLNHI